jgi:hypothetical protein
MEDQNAIIAKLEEQNYELEKQMRAREAVAKKDKAIYEQKIELLELQLIEAKERLFKRLFVEKRMLRNSKTLCYQHLMIQDIQITFLKNLS